MNNLKRERDVLYIVIPAYNERDNIEALVHEWYEVVKRHDGAGRSRLVIINDGSTDDTLSVIEPLIGEMPLLEVITKENGGHGQAVLHGYRHALNSGADYVFQTDSDRQTIPGEFEPFWRQRKRFDVVIGNRRGRGDGLSRSAVSKAEIALLALFLRVCVPDANTPFRLMKASALSGALEYLEPGETIPNIMLTAVFKRMGLRVLFRDITFKNRQAGANTINIKKIARTGAAAVKRFIALDGRLRSHDL